MIPALIALWFAYNRLTYEYIFRLELSFLQAKLKGLPKSPQVHNVGHGVKTAIPEINEQTNSKPHRNSLIGDAGAETFEMNRPPEWQLETIPRKSPYHPQIGDEIVYFRQGHKLYVDAVQQKNVYKLAPNYKPWLGLQANEYAQIIGVDYEIQQPIIKLCCLKLALLTKNGQLKNQTFTVKYHWMADVFDFLVLKQNYDTAVQRPWAPRDRFRYMVNDAWRIGQITARAPYSGDFSDSQFLCFQIRWDNGETDRISPWAIERIDESRMPNRLGDMIHVQDEELQSMLYQPKVDEWPRGDRNGTSRRIVASLNEVMGLAVADQFLVPVDLDTHPEYAHVVAYPIDLTTIKARFENRFYRRIAAAQFDVRQLATNAEKFNHKDTLIVQNARIVSNLCLHIIR